MTNPAGALDALIATGVATQRYRDIILAASITMAGATIGTTARATIETTINVVICRLSPLVSRHKHNLRPAR